MLENHEGAWAFQNQLGNTQNIEFNSANADPYVYNDDESSIFVLVYVDRH